MSARNPTEEREIDRIDRKLDRERNGDLIRRQHDQMVRLEPQARALVDGFIAQVEDPEPHLRALGAAVHAATAREVGPEDAAALFGVLARVGPSPSRPSIHRARAELMFKGRVRA